MKGKITHLPSLPKPKVLGLWVWLLECAPKCVEPGALLGSYEREYYNAPKMEVMNECGYDSLMPKKHLLLHI